MKGRTLGLMAYRAFSDAVGKGTFLIITVLAARLLSPEQFGVFAIGCTLGWIAAVAADFGMQLHVARSVAVRPSHAGGILRAWLTVRLATSIGAVVLTAAVVAATTFQGRYAGAILLLVFAYAISGLTEFTYYFFRGLGRSDLESTLYLSQRTGTVVLVALALLWRPDVTLVAVAMVTPALATSVASVRLATRLRPDTGRPPISLGTDFRQNVVPVGLGILLAALYFRVDVFLLELWRGTEVVGLYNAVFRLVEALRLGPAAALAVWLPMLCRATDLRPLMRISRVLTLSAAVVSLVLTALADSLVPLLYGPAFVAAVPAFRILLLAFPLMALNYALTTQLIGWSGHRAYAALCAAALLVNVGLNSRLIPELSLVGAAWATLGTEILLTIGCLAALAAGLVPAHAVPEFDQVVASPQD